MTETTTEVKRLREDTASLRQQLFSAGKRNEALSKTLRTARDELNRIKEEARRLTEPPNNWGTLVALGDQGVSADVIVSGRRMRVAVGPEVEPTELRPGTDVLLSEGLVIIGTGSFPPVGSVVNVREFIDDTRILVGAPGDDEQVFILGEDLVQAGVRVGDAVVVDTRTHYALQVVEKPEVSSLLLEEVPDTTYSDVGGLADQIGQIKDAVELPFEHPQLYTEHGLKPPKGILLYGPPGCGKTLIAKAVANSLADRTGAGQSRKTYFLNIKGPELLDKYVGETERQLRLIFARAREKASAGFPVVVFFDEMESLFRTRGTGKSSDVETTIVPQLLTEIDGVEQLDNVIVIGASNREDLIDPAILRPGRLDVKIRIERPDADGARDIFEKYLTDELPLHSSVLTGHETPAEGVAALISFCVDRMYSQTPENEFVEVSYADGAKEVLHFSDFASGAMIHNIVDRAKKGAIKSLLETGERGLQPAHFEEAIAEEFSEHEDLPNTTNPDEWARISGRKGERVTHLRMMHLDTTRGAPAVPLETDIAEVYPNSDLV
ncbi:MAG: proteasome ATPase [Brevibacterium sp.]|uniref:proteasome ATPase n=1 Tax=Brevibacterium sp. TaxID=1701 RepID=UPI0026471CCE|nr:proteasome ATPase [Brevibacterium sp.]MDN5805634.1 proteasome ATPase [Brevibacterium sp.]MDN5832317.1 proteasome ATPase [Brevibacterium sp.]MDN5875794.1 proteasome ATPase [Brevibacterium sp.]MDN5909002.1 proteasome ATPase [Brevibacterium sp.]MDN6122735.1 proteasome ATPase [Brevibacterium sp.]